MKIMMTTGNGTNPRYPCPMNVKLSGTSGVTGTPLVIMYIRPRPMLNVPSVAMKGGNWIQVTRNPLKQPTASPTNSPANTAETGPAPCWKASAVTSDDRPITEPTDRSIPPVIMTNIIPMDMIAISENDLNTPIRLFVVRK